MIIDSSTKSSSYYVGLDEEVKRLLKKRNYIAAKKLKAFFNSQNVFLIHNYKQVPSKRNNTPPRNSD